jgi:uncharacterized membrane protein
MINQFRQQHAAPTAAPAQPITLKQIVDQNLEQIIVRELDALHTVNLHQRAIETVTRRIGRPAFLYLLLGVVTGWMLLNVLLMLDGMTLLDPPPFAWLQLIIGLSALLMTTMVLITQNRQAVRAEEYRQLEVQVTLLVEQKVTKLIALLEEMRHDLPNVHDRDDPEAEALKQSLNPHQLLDVLEAHIPAELFDEERDEGQ